MRRSKRFRHAVVHRQEPRRVLADDRHAATHGHAELVERHPDRASDISQLAVREVRHRRSGLVRLVDDGYPVRVHGNSTVEEVIDRERLGHGKTVRTAGLGVVWRGRAAPNGTSCSTRVGGVETS